MLFYKIKKYIFLKFSKGHECVSKKYSLEHVKNVANSLPDTRLYFENRYIPHSNRIVFFFHFRG